MAPQLLTVVRRMGTPIFLGLIIFLKRWGDIVQHLSDNFQVEYQLKMILKHEITECPHCSPNADIGKIGHLWLGTIQAFQAGCRIKSGMTHLRI
jgi:hypothetical protein